MDAAMTLDLLARFFGAIERGEVAAAAACYADDAEIWHNIDQVTAGPAENAATIQAMCETFPVRRYDAVRRIPLAGGAVQQHVLHLERGDGKTIDWPACVVLAIRDGRIVKLEEYIDLTSFTSVMG